MDFLPISFFVGFWNSRKVLIVPRCVIDDGCWLGGRFRPENEIISDMQNDSRKMKGGKCVRVLQTFHVSDQLSRAAAAVAAFHWFTSSSNFSSKKCRRQFFEIIFEFFIHEIPILSSGQDTWLDWKKSLKFSDWPVGIWRPEKIPIGRRGRHCWPVAFHLNGKGQKSANVPPPPSRANDVPHTHWHTRADTHTQWQLSISRSGGKAGRGAGGWKWKEKIKQKKGKLLDEKKLVFWNPLVTQTHASGSDATVSGQRRNGADEPLDRNPRGNNQQNLIY